MHWCCLSDYGVSSHASRQDKLLALSDVDIDIESILSQNISPRSISTVGYILKGRKQVWLKNELQNQIYSTLIMV